LKISKFDIIRNLSIENIKFLKYFSVSGICHFYNSIHSHLLAKFCLFFYSAFALTKKIGGKNQAEKEFQSVASKTVFDFHGRSMELMDKNGAKGNGFFSENFCLFFF